MAQANLDGVDFEGVKLKVEVICHIDKNDFSNNFVQINGLCSHECGYYTVMN